MSVLQKRRGDIMERGLKCSRFFLLAFVYIGLTVCFLMQVRIQVIKFFTGKTSRAMEILAQESLKLPRIAFCLNYPYKADMLSKMNLPAEFFHSRDPKYRNSVPFPNLHETWQRATYSKDELLLRWYFYSGVNGSASVEEVNTLYDGKCFVWSLKDDVSPTSRVIKQLYVGLPENKTGFAFFFHPEASTAGVALDNWASLVIPSNLEENMYYAKEIFVEYHSSLPSEAAPCYDAPEQSYFKCMEKLATQVYFDFPKPKWPEVRGPCWVPQATNVVNASLLSKLGQCDMWESYHCMLTSLKEARLATGSKCKASCFETKYVITTKGKAKQIRKMTDGKPMKTLLVPYYGTTTALHVEEFRLYDFGTIVGQVGGSLGLFLGFSCLQCIKEVIDRAFGTLEVKAVC